MTALLLPGAPRRRTATQRASLVALGVLALFAVVGPLVWRDPVSQDLARFLEPPSLTEPLGRDGLGRSVVARLAEASRLSFLVAVVCVAAAALAGTTAGVLAAWRGGWVDAVLRGLAEALMALPALLLVLLLAATGDGGLLPLAVGIALALSVEWFRVTRARAGLVLGSAAVEAAGLLRLGPVHVVRRHLWPDLRPVLTTLATFGAGTAVVALATLGFVGVGLRPPRAELGLMITEGFPLWSEAPWVVLAPVGVLALALGALLGVRDKATDR